MRFISIASQQSSMTVIDLSIITCLDPGAAARINLSRRCKLIELAASKHGEKNALSGEE
jgi:hypothetical protein